jgi:transposase
MKNPFLSVLNDSNENLTNTPRFHQFYVGIDIGYKFHEAACIPVGYFTDAKQAWKKTKTLKFNADGEGITSLLQALNEVSHNPKDFCVLMEPTGGYYGFVVMKVLEQTGYNTFLVENKAVKDFRERSLGIQEKSDRIDSKVMAYMGFQKALTPSMHGIRLMTSAAPMQAVFKALTTDRWSIQKQITRRKNQLQQILSVTHPELKSVFTSGTASVALRRLVSKYPTAHTMALQTEETLYHDLISMGASSVAKKRSAELKKLLNHTAAIDVPYLVNRQKLLIEDIERMEDFIGRIDEEIKALVDSHPYKPILWSFPCMSYTWACALIGTIGDINRFSTYKQFKKYVGFTAENRESGISVRGTHLSFQGVRDTRRVLFQITFTMMGPLMGDSPFKAHYHRLLSRNMPKMKALGHVCGKLAQVMYSCLKNETLYDPETHYKAIGQDIENEETPES